MNALSIRRALRALLPVSKTERRALVVQHIGFEADQLDTLPAMLDGVGRELGLDITLDRVQGDVVLANQRFVARVAPQVLNAYLEDRPLLTVTWPGAGDDNLRQRARQVHADMVRQLRAFQERGAGAVAALSTLPPSSGFDSGFDSRSHAEQLLQTELDPDRAELLNRLRRGLVDPGQPVLHAGYGRDAALVIDFATGVATIDILAEQRLRVMREVPYQAHGARPLAGARPRELDLVVWDIAVAAGGFRLLHSPVNWWHTPLIVQPQFNVARYTALPQHLEMARCLAQAPLSPADLRRRSRVSLVDLRGFLQASLFIGLAHWLSQQNN